MLVSAGQAVGQGLALAVGQSAERTFLASDAAVRAFAEVTGDRNPVHLDEAYAARSLFRGRIAHGMLLGGYISAVLGEDLPGPGAIYLSQTLSFEHPVRIGAEVRVRVEVLALEGRKAILSTVCSVDGLVVASGQAVVAPPRARRPAAQDGLPT
jgi:3-hydroxybutyryl-CoA dehydratase